MTDDTTTIEEMKALARQILAEAPDVLSAAAREPKPTTELGRTAERWVQAGYERALKRAEALLEGEDR